MPDSLKSSNIPNITASIIAVASLLFSYLQQRDFQIASHTQELKIQELKQKHETEMLNYKNKCTQSEIIISDLADMLSKKDNLQTLSDNKRGSFYKAYSYLSKEELAKATEDPANFSFAVTVMLHKVSQTYKKCYIAE